MRKKFLGLAAALGITVLASWAGPAMATDPLPCTGRVCFHNTDACRCPAYLPGGGKIIPCPDFFQGACSTP